MNNTSKNSYFSLLTKLRRRLVLPGLAAALAMFAAIQTPAYAQDKTGEIDKIFSSATSAGPATPGCTVTEKSWP